MGLEIGRLIGNSAIGGGVAFVEAVFGEQHHLLKQGFCHGPINAPFGGAFDEDVLVFLHLAFLLFAHRPTQQVGLT